MNVERQAYHGKSFIGNHVHTCCKVTQILPLEREFMSHKILLNCCGFFFLGRQYHRTMQCCGDKNRGAVSFLPQAKEISV